MAHEPPHGLPSPPVGSGRWVITESPHDARIYEHAAAALGAHLGTAVSLYFLPAGTKGSASCGRVIELVERLRAEGSHHVRGVLDWDRRTRKRPDAVRVLGEGERYAIENVLLDPALLVWLLLGLPEGRALLGHSRDEWVRLDRVRREELVRRVAAVIGEAAASKGRASGSSFKRRPLDQSTVEVRYVGGAALSLPRWTLVERGHDYARWVLLAFPFLGRLPKEGPNGGAEDQMVCGIAIHALAEAVDWTPACLLTLFLELQAG
ncbi:MAG: hypothetical protein EP330_23360 [Deltaproteobacteria bacterium]|nr:MAG: hypothetical protein EP330_23360 [Deltaproteobacteria bacterium]